MNEKDPSSDDVQSETANHYKLIKQFLGRAVKFETQAEAYTGLGQTYVYDERYTMMDGKPQPEFALFLKNAMEYFVISKIKNQL